mgnify:CR=1 FL=1
MIEVPDRLYVVADCSWSCVERYRCTDLSVLPSGALLSTLGALRRPDNVASGCNSSVGRHRPFLTIHEITLYFHLENRIFEGFVSKRLIGPGL